MTEEENRLLPAYLREMEGEPGRVYGTLSYNRRSKVWTCLLYTSPSPRDA